MTEPRADDPAALVALARAIEKRWEKYCGAIGHEQPEMMITIAKDAIPLLARLADALAASRDCYRRAVEQEELWQDEAAALRQRLSNVRSAASDVLTETAGDTERTFDAAFHKACLMNGTLQFIVEHAALTQPKEPDRG